jgi:hypothetical protein
VQAKVGCRRKKAEMSSWLGALACDRANHFLSLKTMKGTAEAIS